MFAGRYNYRLAGKVFEEGQAIEVTAAEKDRLDTYAIDLVTVKESNGSASSEQRAKFKFEVIETPDAVKAPAKGAAA
jgi:hypothetical protein